MIALCKGTMSALVDTNQNNTESAGITVMRTRFEGKDGCGMEMSDATYRRYLIARKLDVDKATEMLDATLKWRAEIGVADMCNNWMDTLAKEHETGKMYVRGYDNEGHVVIHMQPQYENTKEHDGNIKNLVFNLEKCVACMAQDGRQEKWLLIIDFAGYSMFNAPPMKTSVETLSILQNHYPERLLKACLVNPPWIFMTFWNLIYPLVDPVTQKKLEFVKETGDGLRTKFAEVVDLKSLEVRLGGENNEPFNPACYLEGEFALDYNAQVALAAESSSNSSVTVTDASVTPTPTE